MLCKIYLGSYECNPVKMVINEIEDLYSSKYVSLYNFDF